MFCLKRPVLGDRYVAYDVVCEQNSVCRNVTPKHWKTVKFNDQESNSSSSWGDDECLNRMMRCECRYTGFSLVKCFEVRVKQLCSKTTFDPVLLIWFQN